MKYCDRILGAHPILTACIIVACILGAGAVVWDRVCPGPETVTLTIQ